MRENFYVSSLAFLGVPINEIIQICERNLFNLEFSSGIPYLNRMEEIYIEADLQRMPHNYFPAPEIPFVLNLASGNEKIRNLSIDHCKNGLRISKISNSPFFAAHAGFCIDPNPEELGRKITFSDNFDKSFHESLFESSIKEILEFADSLNVNFLIENNVLAPFNYSGVNPLLCCDSEGINSFFEKINHSRIGLLLDTAHLKVSCKTLDLDKEIELSKIKHHIRAIHHSDNNGEMDDNQSLDLDYWFLKHMNQFNTLVHVLEVKNLSVEEVKRQISLLEDFGN